LRNEHGDAVCIVHGTVWTERRAWDLLDEPPPEAKTAIAPKAGHPWTPDEIQFVVQNRHRMSSKAMARHLQRTEHAVNQVLSKRRLRKRRVANLWVVRKRAKTLEQLEDRARPGTTRRLARRLHLTYWQAYKRLWNRGIRVGEADGMMSVAEVMRHYNCSRERVERLMKVGVLPADRLGKRGIAIRIDPRDAERCAPMLRAKSKHASVPSARKVQRLATRSDTTLPRKNHAQNRDRFFPR
jgi:hypothetical protein